LQLHLPLHYVTSSGFIMFHILQGWAEVLQDDGDSNWRFWGDHQQCALWSAWCQMQERRSLLFERVIGQTQWLCHWEQGKLSINCTVFILECNARHGSLKFWYIHSLKVYLKFWSYIRLGLKVQLGCMCTLVTFKTVAIYAYWFCDVIISAVSVSP
jgi:hypothetical protein